MSAYLSESSAHTESGSSVAAASRVGSTAITSLTALVYTIVTRYDLSIIFELCLIDVMCDDQRAWCPPVHRASSALSKITCLLSFIDSIRIMYKFMHRIDQSMFHRIVFTNTYRLQHFTLPSSFLLSDSPRH